LRVSPTGRPPVDGTFVPAHVISASSVPLQTVARRPDSPLLEKLKLVSEYSRTRKYWNSENCRGDTTCSRKGELPFLYRRALGSSHARRLIRTTEIWRRLAASADAADLAVNVRIFLTKDILRD